MMDGYDMGGWAWIGMLLMAAVTLAIIGGVVWAIASRRPGNPRQGLPSAREQLDARLAQGEIDTREYHERLDALSGGPRTGA